MALDDFDPRNKVAFYRWDDTGYVTANGVMELGHVKEEMSRGENTALGQVDAATAYVDISTKAIRPRPVISPPAKLRVAPRELITLPGVNPTTVYVRGTVSASSKHPGGPLSLGFAITGKYAVSFTPWPAQPVEFTVEVT